MEDLVALAEIIGGFSAALGALIALVGAPWAILQLRHNERQRLLAVLEQSILDHFSQLETRVLDARDLAPDVPEQYSAAAAEIRRLVTLMALIEHRNALEKIPETGAIRYVQLEVANILGQWNGFVAGYFEGLLTDDDTANQEHKEVIERLMDLYEMSSCDEVSLTIAQLQREARAKHTQAFERARRLIGK